jgi:hypothetical protein
MNMDADTIEEITQKINEMKILLSTGIFNKEIQEAYAAKIATWEAEIDMINALT